MPGSHVRIRLHLTRISAMAQNPQQALAARHLAHPLLIMQRSMTQPPPRLLSLAQSFVIHRDENKNAAIERASTHVHGTAD